MNFYGNLSKEEKIRMYKTYFRRNKMDLIISVFFIICSTSTPIISIKNGAVWVLTWYLISFSLMLCSCVNQEEYNMAVKRENHYNRKHNKNRKQKFKIKINSWTFIWIKMFTALILGFILMMISYSHQLQNYDLYIKNEKNFFIGIWFDTYIVTFSVGFYNLIIDEIKNNQNFKCRLNAIFNLTGKSIVKRILNISIFVIFVAALYYSFNEFSIFGNPANYIIGFLYIIALCIPF